MILLLDDEIYVKPYIDALEDVGLDVKQVTNIYKALQELKYHPDKYKLFILDIMMTANKKDLSILEGYDIKLGLRVGDAFIKYLEDNNIAKNINIIILTNVDEFDFHNKYQRIKRIYKCYRKREISPIAFADIISNLIRGKNVWY